MSLMGAVVPTGTYHFVRRRTENACGLATAPFKRGATMYSCDGGVL
jgi:hypothetical protein